MMTLIKLKQITTIEKCEEKIKNKSIKNNQYLKKVLTLTGILQRQQQQQQQQLPK